MQSYDPIVRTRTLARVVGPYLAIMALALIARAGDVALMLPAFMSDAPLVLATGAFTLMAGLAMLAAHHHWSSPAAIVISLIAIAASAKGAWLMLAPDAGAALTAAIVRAPPLLIGAACLDLLLGLYLTYVGWLAKPAA
jgi:hypothetical protein